MYKDQQQNLPSNEYTLKRKTITRGEKSVRSSLNDSVNKESTTLKKDVKISDNDIPSITDVTQSFVEDLDFDKSQMDDQPFINSFGPESKPITGCTLLSFQERMEILSR